MNLKTIFLVTFLGISLVLVVFSAVAPTYPLRLVLVLLAMFFDIIAFSSRFYTYMFLPFLHRKNGNVVLKGDEAFILSPSGNTIIVRDGGSVYASAFIKIPIYKSATEMSDEEKADFSHLFSRVITLSKAPIKISSQMYIVNKDDYINKIQERLNMTEDKYQSLGADKSADPNALNRVKGEVTMWHNLLDSVGRVESYSLISYAMVTAPGGNEEEAVNLVLQQADEIAAGISATLGVTASIAEGPEILLFIQPEQLIPYSTVNEQIRQKTMTEGL